MGNCNILGTKSQYTPSNLRADFSSSTRLHEGSILSVSFVSNNKIITCGDDKCICVTDPALLNNENYLPSILKGHTKAVNRLVHFENFIWSASRDLSIKLVTNYIFVQLLLLE